MEETFTPSLRSGLRLQADAHRVDAVAVAGRRLGGVVEDVPEVAVAGRAEHLGADHPEGAGLAQDHVVRGGRLVARRPSAVRVELGLGAEQFGAAGAAGVDPDGLRVDVLAGPGAFGAGLPEDGVLLARELRPPLVLGPADLRLLLC